MQNSSAWPTPGSAVRASQTCRDWGKLWEEMLTTVAHLWLQSDKVKGKLQTSYHWAKYDHLSTCNSTGSNLQYWAINAWLLHLLPLRSFCKREKCEQPQVEDCWVEISTEQKLESQPTTIWQYGIFQCLCDGPHCLGFKLSAIND